VLSDCEGCEGILLNTDVVETLQTSTCLIELHEEQSPGVTNRLRTRFSSSHDLTFINVGERNPSNYPELREIPKEERGLGVREYRSSSQQWLYARPV